MFGDIVNAKLADIVDLTPREVLIFAPLIAGTLWLGLQPDVDFNLTAASVDNLVAGYRAATGG